MLGTILTILSVGIILIAVAITMGPIRDLLKSKLSRVDYETLCEIAKTAVTWAEKWLDGKTGAEKKEEVLVYIVNACDTFGLFVTDDDIEKAIESAVYQVKG